MSDHDSNTKEDNFSLIGFEPQPPGTDSQCATIELRWLKLSLIETNPYIMFKVKSFCTILTATRCP